MREKKIEETMPGNRKQNLKKQTEMEQKIPLQKKMCGKFKQTNGFAKWQIQKTPMDVENYPIYPLQSAYDLNLFVF